MHIPACRRVHTARAALFTLIACTFWCACSPGTDPITPADPARSPSTRDRKTTRSVLGVGGYDYNLETPESDPTFFNEMQRCISCHGTIYNTHWGDGLVYIDADGNILGRRDSSVFYYPSSSGHPPVDGDIDIR